MHRILCSLAVMLAVLTSAWAAERSFGLRGQIEPAPGRASVTLEGADAPFTASTVTDSKGRFRFQELAPGPYTVTVFVPGVGIVRRTVEVSPSLADAEGRITVTIPFSPSDASASGALKGRSTVSLRELSIPQRAREEYNEAEKRLSKRDVAGAVKHLKRAVELAPQFALAWNRLGTIAYHAGNYEQAEKYFRQALEQQPDAFSPAVNLGGVLLNLGRYGEALKYNQYAVETSPEDALANAQLGMSYFFLGQHDEAVRYLNVAKRLDPSHFTNPQVMLAEIYLRRSDRQSAIKELEEFLALHPDSVEAEKVRKHLERLKR